MEIQVAIWLRCLTVLRSLTASHTCDERCTGADCLALITRERLISHVRHDMPVEPRLLPKLHPAVGTRVRRSAMSNAQVLSHDSRRLELFAALRARPRRRLVRVHLVTAHGRPRGKPPAALVTHVRLVAAVRPHVHAQRVRHEEALGALRALVLRLAADAVLPEVTPQRVLPDEFLAAHVTLVAQLLRVDAHVHVQVRHAAEPAAALGAHVLLLRRVDAHVCRERIGRRVEASALIALVRSPRLQHISRRLPCQLRSQILQQ